MSGTDNAINSKIIQLSEALEEKVIAHRRQIHTFAELGGQEYKTHAYICAELDRLGVGHEDLGMTGVIGTYRTDRPGPGIVLRADIDALPMPENPKNLAGQRSCISEQENTCHACGHDAHSAMLLGSIEALLAMSEYLSGTLYFVFEAGEECAYGIQDVLDALHAREVDTIWGIHVYAPLASGKLSVTPGPRMAGGSPIHVRIIGKGGHGSRPDLANNPVLVAAKIACELPSAIMYRTDAEKTITCAVTSIQGGESGNVIPDEATLLGTLRWFDVEEGKKAVELERQIIEGTAALYGCSVEYGPMHGQIGIPVVNDAGCAQIANSALSEVLPEGTLVDCERWYASESMSIYLNEYPGVFAFLGIYNPPKGSGAAHHNGFFDVDEDVLKTGVVATVKYVFGFLEAGREEKND